MEEDGEGSCADEQPKDHSDQNGESAGTRASRLRDCGGRIHLYIDGIGRWEGWREEIFASLFP
jgi:hypothetical protein